MMKVNEHYPHIHQIYNLWGGQKFDYGPFLLQGTQCPEGHSYCAFPYSAFVIRQDSYWYYHTKNIGQNTLMKVHDFYHIHGYANIYGRLSHMLFLSWYGDCPKVHTGCVYSSLIEVPTHMATGSVQGLTEGPKDLKVNSKIHRHKGTYYEATNVNDNRPLSSMAVACPEGHSYCRVAEPDYRPCVVDVVNTLKETDTTYGVG